MEMIARSLPCSSGQGRNAPVRVICVRSLGAFLSPESLTAASQSLFLRLARALLDPT